MGGVSSIGGPGRREQPRVDTGVTREPRGLLQRGPSLVSPVGCVSRAPTGSVPKSLTEDCPRGALGWGRGWAREQERSGDQEEGCEDCSGGRRVGSM